MTDDRDKLRATLDQLRAQLETTSGINPRVAAQLDSTLKEIEGALAGEQPSEPSEQPLSERLSQAARHFEASHPTLAGTLGSVIDALSRMGI
jgi:hypothetical protein